MPEPREFDFDWVTPRSHCTLENMFNILRQVAKKNTATRNAQVGQLQFEFKETVSSGRVTEFTVFDTTDADGRNAADFSLGANTIDINAAEHLQATVLCDDRVDFKFVLVGQAGLLDPWQLLRRVLEPVLFK